MIDNLPSGWRVEELNNISNFINGFAFKSSQFQNEGIPIVRIGNLLNEVIDLSDKVSYEENTKLEPYLLQKNDILIAMSGATTGKIAYNKHSDKLYLNQRIGCLRVKESILPKYLFNFLKGKKNYLLSLAGGSAQPNLSSNDIKKVNIPIPPLEQQEKIVKVLDLTSNLIEKQKELLEKYDLFLKSKFIEMFGDPISNPMGWENDVLSNVCPNKGDFVDGPFGSDLKVSDRTDEGIRIIQINNVGENEFRDKNKAFIRQEKYLTLKRHEVLQNDIIIAKMGEPIARSCFLPKHIDKAIIVADCMRMRITNNDYNRVFICFYLNFYTTKVLIDNLSHGSTRTRINLSILKTLEIIKPKVELQNKFALIVEKIETIKEKENQKLKQFEDLHNSMMNKAFKGEIK